MLFKDDKKGNFAIIISFMFGLFLVVFLFYAAFFSYQYQINSQYDLLKQNEQNNPYAQTYTSYKISTPYEFMGRTSYKIENTGNNPLIFSNKDIFCFDIFAHNEYFNREKARIQPKKTLASKYGQLPKNENGTVFLQSKNLEEKDISFTSCNGITSKVNFDSNSYFWWNHNWDSRVNITAPSQPISYNVQINGIYNENSINFTEFRENDLRVFLSLNQYFVYELPMDTLVQSDSESSSLSQNVILGDTSSVESSDPELENGVLFEGFSFNGSQYVKTPNFIGLNGSKEATISFWIKDSSLEKTQTIISNDELISVISPNSSPQDIAVQWKFNESSGINHTFSNVLEEDIWNFITIRLNNSQTCVYKNTALISCETDTDSILSPNASTLTIGETFSGNLDELSISSIALQENEIKSLYYGNSLFRELPYTINDISIDNENLDITATFPKVLQTHSLDAYIYYDN